MLLKELHSDLRAELTFIREIIEENPKNYQVWHHRRVIVDCLQDPSHELRFTEIILSQDAKNYHAWQHRQWVLSTFKILDDELDYIERLLAEDVRNNSAWNQRFFVINLGNIADVADREIAYAVDALKKVSDNESAWSYLRGVLKASQLPLKGKEEVEDLCAVLKSRNCQSPHFLAFTLDQIDEELAKDAKEVNKSLLSSALEICRELAEEVDPIRKEYWSYQSRVLLQQYS
uniref:Protein farnesyltransferase/geranylgeranyltransferase type-1 subunit alpha n=1 Tax=Lynceus sp. MCZ IZ 141354 TaxID=1930659 RepID=A0A9N6ZEM6_9CRUS|nr:EOG090X08PK [Lynceus sp. MCZ IZ 141354]